MKESEYVFNNSDVVTNPVRRSTSKKDLLLGITQCSGEAWVNVEPVARPRTDKDLYSGSVLCSRKTRGKNECVVY